MDSRQVLVLWSLRTFVELPHIVYLNHLDSVACKGWCKLQYVIKCASKQSSWGIFRYSHSSNCPFIDHKTIYLMKLLSASQTSKGKGHIHCVTTSSFTWLSCVMSSQMTSTKKSYYILNVTVDKPMGTSHSTPWQAVRTAYAIHRFLCMRCHSTDQSSHNL